MNWEIPPLQGPNSKDCEKFAVAYISRLLGFDTNWKDVQKWEEQSRKTVDLYPYFVHGIKPFWTKWTINNEPPEDACPDRYKKSFSRSIHFKEWVINHVNQGCVGYASTFLVDWIGHAIVLLDADDEGILFADSARGLVNDSWDKFINPLGKEHRYVSRVQTWYKIR